jgi:hypothetical protein
VWRVMVVQDRGGRGTARESAAGQGRQPLRVVILGAGYAGVIVVNRVLATLDRGRGHLGRAVAAPEVGAVPHRGGGRGGGSCGPGGAGRWR